MSSVARGALPWCENPKNDWGEGRGVLRTDGRVTGVGVKLRESLRKLGGELLSPREVRGYCPNAILGDPLENTWRTQGAPIYRRSLGAGEFSRDRSFPKGLYDRNYATSIAP